MSTDTSQARSEACAPIVGLRKFFAWYWWALALRGCAAVTFGLIALFMPSAAILSLVLIFAAYMFVDGALATIAAVLTARQGERRGLLLLEGIVDLVIGVIVLLWPAITVVIFVLLIAAWAILSGTLMLGAALRLTRRQDRWWLAMSGTLSIAFAVLLVIAPFAGAIVLTWWLGAYALISGIVLLILAFKLRAAANA